MIRSVYEDQTDILKSIMTLNNLEEFCADISYGNGQFYKEIKEPNFKFDIAPQVGGVTEACSTDLPIEDDTFKSIVFDPPFLTYVRAAREGNGNMIMAKRFSGYWRYDELEDHYFKTLSEASRVLKRKGLLIFKCQDIIHNHKMHCTHLNVVKWAEMHDFRLKDLFILPAKSRMPIPQQEGTKKKQQKHARIFHSYFLVLENNK